MVTSALVVDLTPSEQEEARFLQELFDALNAGDVEYAVMRNLSDLPPSRSATDLDLLVAPWSKAACLRIVASTLQQRNIVILGSIRSTRAVKLCLLAGRAPFWGLTVDLNFGFSYRGHDLIDMQRWRAPERPLQGPPRLANGQAALLGLLKEIFNNVRYDGRYTSDAAKEIAGNWPTVAELLAPIGPTALRHLHDAALHEFARGPSAAQIRSAAIRFLVASRPVGSARAFFAYEYSRFLRILFPPGLVVAITGVDGSGKSTLIASVKPVLAAATHRHVYVNHLRPGLLPPLAALLSRGKKKSTGPVRDPHGSTPSGMLGSIIRALYLLFDYNLGYWLKVRPKISRLPSVVIFDRYLCDLVVDPRRFRIRLPVWAVAAIGRMAPQPDLLIGLWGDPKVIQRRKEELDLEETTRQVSALKRLAADTRNAALVRTDGSVENARDQILGAIARQCHAELGDRSRESLGN